MDKGAFARGFAWQRMADQLADEAVLLHGVPIRGRGATVPHNLERSREEMERQHSSQNGVQHHSMAAPDRRPTINHTQATQLSITHPVSTVVVRPAVEPEVTGSNPGLDIFLYSTQPSQGKNSLRPLVLLPIPAENATEGQEMELKRRESLTAAIGQKWEMIRQHHLDMRQMALLLHLQLGWQQWHSQQAEWWSTAKKWTKGLRRATMQTEERRGREEIRGDRGYWSLGVMTIHYDGIRGAMESEEKRQRIMLKLLSKENRYRILQETREREQRQTIVEHRLRGWERISRRKQKDEEREARRQLRMEEEQNAAWNQQMEQRRAIEVEELTRKERLEAGHRRLRNDMHNMQDSTLTQTDITETRQYLVPLTLDLPQAVRSHRSTQYGFKRRREQPSDGRERSPRPKRRRTPNQ